MSAMVCISMALGLPCSYIACVGFCITRSTCFGYAKTSVRGTVKYFSHAFFMFSCET